MDQPRGISSFLSAVVCCAIMLGCALPLAGCASDPKEPGAELWYTNRIQEIEAAKAAGQLTEAEYLTLKNQADATRASRINATRYNNDDDFFGPW